MVEPAGLFNLEPGVSGSFAGGVSGFLGDALGFLISLVAFGFLIEGLALAVGLDGLVVAAFGLGLGADLGLAGEPVDLPGCSSPSDNESTGCRTMLKAALKPSICTGWTFEGKTCIGMYCKCFLDL